MAVRASAETIREMERRISRTIRDIEHINNGIHAGLSSISGWDDSKAAEFTMLMKKIAQLTTTPVSTLNASLPKLERLAQALDQYNNVHF